MLEALETPLSQRNRQLRASQVHSSPAYIPPDSFPGQFLGPEGEAAKQLPTSKTAPGCSPQPPKSRSTVHLLPHHVDLLVDSNCRDAFCPRQSIRAGGVVTECGHLETPQECTPLAPALGFQAATCPISCLGTL